MIPNEYAIDDKVAIVTGSGRGMGKAIALTLAEAGADIALVARTRSELEQTAEEIDKIGRRAVVLPTDITQEELVKRAVEQTVKQFGRIDILVNNAGIFVTKPVAYIPGKRFPGWEVELVGDNWNQPLTLQDWHRIMDTNLISAFLFAQAAGPHMMRRGKGKVINNSSTSADVGTPYFSAYCASKAGLNAFTRCLASEWAPYNINVNAVAPGAVKTDILTPFMENTKVWEPFMAQVPLGRPANPREIALLVLFLASAASDYMTGQIFTIDGGAMGHGPSI